MENKIILGNKTFWWKFWTPLHWLLLKLSDVENKKSWPEYNIGRIKHKHQFEGKIIEHSGYHFQECTHYGCNIVNAID